MNETFLLCDRLFDGERFLDGRHLLTLRGEHIAEVRRLADGDAVPTSANDLRGKTVMPGLINTHVHIARGGAFEADESPAPRQVVRNFHETLRAGVTTVADLGCTAPLIASLRAHVALHPLEGPSVLAAGPIVTAPGGYPTDWLPGIMKRAGVALTCGTELEAERAIARIADAGMDQVKMAVMHQSYAAQPMPAIEVHVAAAAVKEAHRQGLRVLAHAHSDIDYRVSLAAGVDAIVHSSLDPLDESTVALVRDAGIPICPTLWVFESACFAAEWGLERDERFVSRAGGSIRKSWRTWTEAYSASSDVLPAGIAGGLAKSRAAEAIRVSAANLKLLRDAGVPIAFGSDANYGFSLVSRPTDELKTMHRAGMSGEDIMRSATSIAASLLGRTDRGTLAPGKRADVLALDGDPRDEITAFEKIHAIWSAGTLVTGKPTPWGILGAFARGLAGTVLEAVG